MQEPSLNLAGRCTRVFLRWLRDDKQAQTLPPVTKLEACLIIGVVTLWFASASAVILLALPTAAQIPVLLVWCAAIWQIVRAFRDLKKASPSGKAKAEATNTAQRQTEQST